MFKPRILHLWWLLVFLSGYAHAVTESPKSFISLQLENDAFSLINYLGDHYYTHGTSLSILKVKEPPKWLKIASKYTPFRKKTNGLNLTQYTLGQKIFTPNNTSSSSVVLNDRPYAGYLYYGISTLSHTRYSDSIDYGHLVEITFGLVGPSALGQETQAFIHSIIKKNGPNGWNNQLKNELTVGVTYSRLWRMIKPVTNNLMIGINRHDSIALGNAYTYLASGVMLRFGKNLKKDVSPPTIRPGFPGLPYFQATNKTNWYFYFGIEGRLVLRNIFLDGNSFTNSLSVDKEPLVGDTQLGVVFMFGDTRISASKIYRTDEFKTQEEKDIFGEINLSIRY